MERLPDKAIAAKRKHPVAYACLMVCTLLPMVIGITGLGMMLKRLAPSPGGVEIAAGAAAFILLVPVLMCLGAWIWVAISHRLVERAVAKAFFVHPGFGLLSRVSKRLFVSVYGEDDGPLT